MIDGVDITTSISGSDPTAGITPGTVSASKVLLVDSNKNLTGMGNLTSTGTITASTLTGTLSAGSQTGISAVGTLSSLTSNGDVNVAQHDGSTQGLKLSGTLVTATASDLNKLTNVTNGTTSASKALVVDVNKDLTGVRNLTSTGTISASTLTGSLSAGAQTGISAVGTLTGLVSNNDVDIAQHDGSTKGLKLQGTLVTATSADLNKLTNVTEGNVSASKVVIADTNKDLSGIRNLTTTGTISGVTTLTATTLTGTLSAGAQTGISAVGTLTSLTSNGDVNIAQHDGSTQGLRLAGTLVNATATDLNKLSNVTASAADLNTTTGVTAGTVTASKHLVVDSDKDLTGIRNLTSTGTISGVTTLTASTVSATTLTGTLSAGAQNNVTTLTGATSVGQNSSTVLTGTLATASQPNVTTLAGVTSIGASNSTTLTGTLQTPAQAGITSVGTLTSLALSGGISSATTINSSGIFTNTNTTDSTSSTTGALVLSGGVGINDTADASSSTNGGSLTTAGGAAIAKKLFVGSDLTVGGNLTISGTTTTINSTTTTITDNTLLLNSGPAGTGYDSGVLTQRYQIDNSTGAGDIVNDNAKETYAISSGTTSTITLPGSANATNNYYNNWWIKITSGTQNNQVRKITAYNGTTKVATLSTNLGGSPSANDNINLYNKSFTSLLWNESDKRFISAFTSNDTSTPGALTVIDFADFTAKNITGTLATASQPNVTSVGTLTGLTVSGTLTLGSTAVTATATEINYNDITTIGTAEASKALVVDSSTNITGINSLSCASLTVNGVSITSGGGGSTPAELTDVTPGTASASKALVVDSSINITGINNLTSTNLTTNRSIIAGDTAVSAPSWGLNGIQFRTVGVTYTNTSTASSTTVVNSVFSSFARPTLAATNTSVTTTDAATVYIENSPLAGSRMTITNSHALLVAAGTSTFGGTVNVGRTSVSAPYWGANGILFRTNGIICTNSSTASSGTASETVFNSFGRPTLAATNTSVTTTNAATVFIENSPLAGSRMTITNSYALWIYNGNSLFGGNIILNNASSNLSLTGASSTITISNTTASTSSTTGALQVAGGAYFGANSLFGGNIILNNASGNLSLTGASSTITISNTTASTNSSTGALRVAGGAYFGANSVFAGNIYTSNGVSSGGNITTTGATSSVGSSTYLSASTYIMSYLNSSNANFIGSWANLGYWGLGYDSASSNTIRLGLCNVAGVVSGYANFRCNSVYATGNISVDTVSGYGYFTSGQNIGSAGAQTNTYSIYAAGRIACNGELNVISDYRTKNSIEVLDNNYCQNFIENTVPVKFNYNNDQTQKHFGYIAQDVYKAGFTDLVALCPQEGLEEVIEDDGFINPKDVSFAMSTNELIPILHNVIKNQQTKITNLEQKNIDLESRLTRLEAFINTLEIAE